MARLSAKLGLTPPIVDVSNTETEAPTPTPVIEYNEPVEEIESNLDDEGIPTDVELGA